MTCRESKSNATVCILSWRKVKTQVTLPRHVSVMLLLEVLLLLLSYIQLMVLVHVSCAASVPAAVALLPPNPAPVSGAPQEAAMWERWSVGGGSAGMEKRVFVRMAIRVILWVKSWWVVIKGG